jgi:DNA-binding response OmpR family regulator
VYGRSGILSKDDVVRLLVVEDDKELADGLARSLAQSSYVVDICPTAEMALAAAAAFTYDLIVLDLGLPDMDGIDLLKTLRAKGARLPVIVLTARDRLADRIKGLDVGADDYLVKPIDLSELEARIRAQLRRVQNAGPTQSVGNLTVDDVHRQASVEGRVLDLTAREFAVLEILVRSQGRIVARERMYDGIYDAASEANPTAIEVHVSRLRKKLDTAGATVGIRALRGLGYRIEFARQ